MVYCLIPAVIWTRQGRHHCHFPEEKVESRYMGEAELELRLLDLKSKVMSTYAELLICKNVSCPPTAGN